MNTPMYTKDGPRTISPAIMSTYPESFPYCQRGKLLLQDLKRSDWLPPYDDEGVRAVIDECRKLQELIIDISEKEDMDSPSVKFTLNTFHSSISRNKRCVLAYLNHRIIKIEELYWKTGSPVLTLEYAQKLSRSELEYYSHFQELIAETMGKMDLDLTSHSQPPTHELFIEVRVLQQAGEVLLQSGARVFLEKNTTHFLRRSDVEHLIRQNILEHVS